MGSISSLRFTLWLVTKQSFGDIGIPKLELENEGEQNWER